MNNFHPESLLAIAKQRSQAEADWCLTESPLLGNVAQHLLSSLGSWMVARGQKLQSLQNEALQTKLTISHNKVWKARA
ncbi:MAG: hypothetical protein HZB50_04920 [Chloroflexi bacterium]|nr:hypothetical protein [Chloroflexota bacterium]